MFEKFETWMEDHREEIDFAYIVTALTAICYGAIWSVNWILVKFLDFTGLWLILLCWIGWSISQSVGMYQETIKKAIEEEDDEHSLL